MTMMMRVSLEVVEGDRHLMQLRYQSSEKVKVEKR
jgi:hypothetical protein